MHSCLRINQNSIVEICWPLLTRLLGSLASLCSSNKWHATTLHNHSLLSMINQASKDKLKHFLTVLLSHRGNLLLINSNVKMNNMLCLRIVRQKL